MHSIALRFWQGYGEKQLFYLQLARSEFSPSRPDPQIAAGGLVRRPLFSRFRALRFDSKTVIKTLVDEAIADRLPYSARIPPATA